MLLRGPSGVGKSDLALQALGAGWRLVADDRTVVWASGGRLFGRAPGVLHGLVEARGQAIRRLAPRTLAPVDLVADLVGPEAQVERLPEPDVLELCGVARPRVLVRAREASALSRLALALHASVSPAATPPL